MKITIWGAARGVTGSRHLLELGRHKLLLECGLFQGHRAESERRNREFPFNPAQLDAVVLSHAHIDHSGNLPLLVREGFRGPVFCTDATKDLCNVMLRDSAHIHEKDVEFLNKRRAKRGEPPKEPLYEAADAERAIALFNSVGYHAPFTVGPWEVVFLDAGHILGSAMIRCLWHEDGTTWTLFFTGDLGRPNLPIIRDPEPMGEADVLVAESTYGARLHSSPEDIRTNLAEVVNRVVKRAGKVIIPAFSVGRSQEVVYTLSELVREDRVPQVPIYVDSPLTVNATEVFRRHRECFDDETWEVIRSGDAPFGMGLITYIEDVEESKRLNQCEHPCVIISASGMCEAGRILHHLRNHIEDARNAVLIVGYMADGTLGRRLAEGAHEVRIFGEPHHRGAEVVVLDSFSAHADRNELLTAVAGMPRHPQLTLLVHGEPEQSFPLADALREGGHEWVEVPELGASYTFPDGTRRRGSRPRGSRRR